MSRGLKEDEVYVVSAEDSLGTRTIHICSSWGIAMNMVDDLKSDYVDEGGKPLEWEEHVISRFDKHTKAKWSLGYDLIAVTVEIIL